MSGPRPLRVDLWLPGDDRVPTSRPGEIADSLSRDPLIRMSSPTWCDWCETARPRSLADLHRCPVCARRCCREVEVSPRDVAAAMSQRPTSQQRVWEP